MKTKSFFVVAALSASILAPPAAVDAQAAGGRIPDQYLVQVQAGADPSAVAARHNVNPRFVYRAAANGFAGVIPPGLLQRIQNDPLVTAVIPNRIVTAIQTANGKPGGGGSTSGEVVPAGVIRIGAAPGTLTVTGANVGVAIVDTGIDLVHSDLAANLGAAHFSAFGSSAQDDHGHGTHVAGTVAAVDNEIGVVGVAPGAKLYAVKVLDASGSGTDADVAAGLNWVAANAASVTPPIRVVNMSLGREGSVDDNPLLRDAVQSLRAQGITIVVAAGNDPKLEVSQQVPASYPEVIAVASTTAKDGASVKVGGRVIQIKADTASYFTTDGVGVAISAPGEDQENVRNGGILQSVGILSTARGGGTTRMSGTSMASPHVAGVAALLYSKNSAITPDDVLGAIVGSADRATIAPLDSPTSNYTFDGEREGVVSAGGALNLIPAPLAP